jgi:hypothetical protein
VSYDYGGWGIYFDEGSTGIVATNNIVDHVKSAGLHQNYGQNNVVTNTIFAFGTVDQLERTKAEDHLSFTLSHNIIYYDSGGLLAGDWSGSQYALDHNLYWAGGSPVTFKNGESFAQWQASGQDAGSQITDPMFVDAAHGDFRLKTGSPANAVGFKQIDTTGIGSGRPLPPFTDPPAFPIGFSSH